MRMDKAKPPEPSGSSSKPANVGKFEVSGVSEDYVAYDSVTGEQNAYLSAKLSGERGKMFGQFGRNDLLERDAPPEGPLQSPPLGLF